MATSLPPSTSLYGGKGARIVFDPVGGPTVAKLTAAMAERGILFLTGRRRSGF